MRKLTLVLLALAGCATPKTNVDVRSRRIDLHVPPISQGSPGPGKRVRVTAPEFRGTDVHHVLYLPTDWEPRRRYPVIVEYAGNGPYRNKFGDVSTGRVDGSKLGFGISGGEGFIWVCLPFVSADGQRNARRWWGDLDKTVAYCKTVVPRICEKYSGDPRAVILAGFSRGAIACNFVGLHDDEIAKLWCGFVCHSHYDGVRRWKYAGSDLESARSRLARLGTRPQWISHEQSVDDVRRYLKQASPRGRFTIRTLPYRNHTDDWVLRDVPLRRELRIFVRSAVRDAQSRLLLSGYDTRRPDQRARIDLIFRSKASAWRAKPRSVGCEPSTVSSPSLPRSVAPSR